MRLEGIRILWKAGLLSSCPQYQLDRCYRTDLDGREIKYAVWGKGSHFSNIVHLLGPCRKTSHHNIMGINHVKRRQLWICSIPFLYLYQLELLIKEEGNGRP